MSQKICDTEVFSRVTGFFRPVQSWNKGKREEFKDRTMYEKIGQVEQGVETQGSCKSTLV